MVTNVCAKFNYGQLRRPTDKVLGNGKSDNKEEQSSSVENLSLFHRIRYGTWYDGPRAS